MSKTVTVRLRVPAWVKDEDVRRIARRVLEELESIVPVDVIRRELGVGDKDLVDRLEPLDWSLIEDKELERLRRIAGD